MNRTTVGQLRGAKDLIEDALLAGTDVAQRLQLSVARQPYAILERITPIAVPVRAVEQAQLAITLGIFGAIRSVTRASGFVANHALDLIER